MADKDEFKFDDDDSFPETDLSSAFSDGEQTAQEEPEYQMTIKKAGGSRIRILLLLLLLVVAGAGAGYYFLMMEEAQAPAAPPAKAVAVAPKPAPAPVPVPPPPAKPAAPEQPAPAAAPVTPAPTKPVTAAVPPAPKPETQPVPAAAAPPSKPAVAAPAAEPAPAAKLIASSGPWLIEAGTYVNASELKSVKQKIRTLGYEPQLSTMQKPVRMTRLRIGSYPESEVKEALAYARGIAPDAFVLRSGGEITLYAGTFTSGQNLRQMAERFSSEGVSVAEEPIEVKRTITLVRFGGFPDQKAAGEIAAKARRVGIVAEIIKSK